MPSLNFVQYNLEKATRVPYKKEQSSFCPLTTHENLNPNILCLTQASGLSDCCSEQAEMFTSVWVLFSLTESLPLLSNDKTFFPAINLTCLCSVKHTSIAVYCQKATGDKKIK